VHFRTSFQTVALPWILQLQLK